MQREDLNYRQRQILRKRKMRRMQRIRAYAFRTLFALIFIALLLLVSVGIISIVKKLNAKEDVVKVKQHIVLENLDKDSQNTIQESNTKTDVTTDAKNTKEN